MAKNKRNRRLYRNSSSTSGISFIKRRQNSTLNGVVSIVMDKTNREIDWKDESDRFVLYLDIMGFKERVKNTNISELKKSLQKFKDKIVKLNPLMKGPDGKQGIKNFMKMVQFSDSIVVATKGSSKDDLNHITRAAVILMHIAFETGFALRGVISCGKMVFDEENQLFFGNALVDAYLLEQEICCYGVIFHATSEDIVSNALNDNNGIYFPIEDIDIKLKSGVSKHYYVAWHKMKKDLSEGDITEKALGWLDNLRKTVSGNPRVYLDNTKAILEKSQNNSNCCESKLPAKTHG